jgi:crotonobetainyl-CoA:carnitine CoA-transferase CaiB-like acyl-CoA transferase
MAPDANLLGPGLLDGVRVLDFGIWRPVPYATQLLAEHGADVLKVEPPGGDPMRIYHELFATLHAGKRSIELDLKDPGGLARALELAAAADVVVEGFRPGVADRLGIGADAVRERNPSVVYCSISGFGQDGPLAAVPGHDLDYQAWAGVLAPDGGPPVEAGVPLADLAGGLAAAFAICAALVRRSRSGEGERIDLAMADVLATWTGTAAPVATGVDREARGVAGYGVFEAAGGWIALGVVVEDHFWSALCRVLGLDDVANLGYAERVADRDALQARLRAAIARRPRDVLVSELMAADVPVAPVLDRTGMSELDHFRHRGVVIETPWSPVATGPAVRLEHHAVGRSAPPPALGEHGSQGFGP